MNDFAVDGDFEKSPVATLPTGGQIGASAGKSAWYVVATAFVGGEYGLGGEEGGPSRSGRPRGYTAFSKRGETLTGGGRGQLVKGPTVARFSPAPHFSPTPCAMHRNPDEALSNVLIRTPTEDMPGHHHHQMVPCTPGPASAEKGLVAPACGPLDGAHFGAYQGSDDDCRDYFLHAGDKGTFEQEAFLFGSSDEDAVSGEVQLNLVTGQSVNLFDEGNSPAMIHTASKTLAKKNKAKAAKKKPTKMVPKATKKSARAAASRARKMLGDPSALAVGNNGGVSDVINVSSMAVGTRSSGVAASALGLAKRSNASVKGKAKAAKGGSLETWGITDDADREITLSLLSSQDLKTPISSQQSQGSQRSSGKKKPSRKTLAGRPVNTPITKKLGKADKKSIIRRASLPWIFGTVTCPRTGAHLREGGVPPAEFCTQCNATSTPVWRAGPFGHKTLCNACGVRWMKQLPSQRMK